ncbi:MAG: DUF1592 domain-containing protein, partial [Planctomycetaceae bacterium]|nr:DUF1592 domain-containing protein [Planctomycetaceae bacterium]
SSPSFLFRYEPDPNPAIDGATRLLNEYELATRLSYFLWSSMPDEELFAAAADGRLRDELDSQVRRMIADPKSRALVENFGGQWLTLRNLANFDPSPTQFPEFDEQLRAAMLQETYALFDHIMREDRSVFEFLTADYTFLNERLAKHYGIDGVTGDELRRVDLPDGSHRGGLLTQGTFLVVTSNPSRTSPVKRGLFILDNILGTPAPPAPGAVPELEQTQEQIADQEPTLREVLELHRREPLCKSCHERFDPLGLALENFNALAMWRETEAGRPIDPSGQLITGEAFSSLNQLKQILKQERRFDFYRCVSERLLTYALGRGLEPEDEETLDRLVAELDASGGQTSALIGGIVKSAAFQRMRPAEPRPVAAADSGETE